MWMFEAIVNENKEEVTKEEAINPNIKSEVGKGLIAPPAATKITRMSSHSWPDLQPLQLRMESFPSNSFFWLDCSTSQ